MTHLGLLSLHEHPLWSGANLPKARSKLPQQGRRSGLGIPCRSHFGMGRRSHFGIRRRCEIGTGHRTHLGIRRRSASESAYKVSSAFLIEFVSLKTPWGPWWWRVELNHRPWGYEASLAEQWFGQSLALVRYAGA